MVRTTMARKGAPPRAVWSWDGEVNGGTVESREMARPNIGKAAKSRREERQSMMAVLGKYGFCVWKPAIVRFVVRCNRVKSCDGRPCSAE